MTVAQLIEYLRTQAPDTRVVVAGYEGGYNDLTLLKTLRLQPDARTEWWYGQHDDTETGEPALLLAGENRLSEAFLQKEKGGGG